MNLTKACDILDLNFPFTLKELKKAYYKTALKHHPDKNILNNDKNINEINCRIEEGGTVNPAVSILLFSDSYFLRKLKFLSYVIAIMISKTLSFVPPVLILVKISTAIDIVAL